MGEINIECIRELCENKNMRWTNHVLVRMLKRNININDVENALMTGEIIEQYPDDYPYPSCLLLGLTVKNNPIHVVCGTNILELYLITAYYPNPEEWSEDFKIRKEKNQ